MNGKYTYDINSPPFVPSVNSGRALSPVEGSFSNLLDWRLARTGSSAIKTWEFGLIFPVLDLALKPAHFPDQS